MKMKKVKQTVTADGPMGIVIAMGSIAPSNPRVRAYFWCDFEPSGIGSSEDDAHFLKA